MYPTIVVGAAHGSNLMALSYITAQRKDNTNVTIELHNPKGDFTSSSTYQTVIYLVIYNN